MLRLLQMIVKHESFKHLSSVNTDEAGRRRPGGGLNYQVHIYLLPGHCWVSACYQARPSLLQKCRGNIPMAISRGCSLGYQAIHFQFVTGYCQISCLATNVLCGQGFPCNPFSPPTACREAAGKQPAEPAWMGSHVFTKL